jgi:hypothetical protein
MPINHTIVVRLKDGQHAIPNEVMEVGETVSFWSPDGNVTVVYAEGWPFEGDPGDITDSRPRKLKTEGVFPFRCFLTLSNGNKVGWSPTNPMSGADTRVGKG